MERYNRGAYMAGLGLAAVWEGATLVCGVIFVVLSFAIFMLMLMLLPNAIHRMYIAETYITVAGRQGLFLAGQHPAEPDW